MPHAATTLAPAPAPDPALVLHHGEAWNYLRDMPAASVHAVVTDPPYSSGGMTRSDRALQTTATKYASTGSVAQSKATAGFSGDNRDQRGFIVRSDEHTSELQSLMRTTYAV